MAKLPDKINFDDIFWKGKIVNVDKNPTQRTLMSGGSWGYRYRVRLISDFSENDNVSDDEVFVAQSFLPTTAGTGAAGRSESLKLSQGDMVFGVYIGTSLFITQAFPRTTLVPKNGKGKYAIESGFTSKVKPGLQELQEFVESMTTEQFTGVQGFFDSMPKLRHEIEYENPNTKVMNKTVLEGMQSFLV